LGLLSDSAVTGLLVCCSALRRFDLFKLMTPFAIKEISMARKINEAIMSLSTGMSE
jgi:hypothetical protein